MADQTQGAVDSLVGLLSTAIKDEARLLGGVHGDMQFIKDEMESMNGFLLHLTKTEEPHDDQLRAWMKQVRDIAYIAQDCIELYRRDFAGPSDDGVWAFLGHLPTLLISLPARHRLANRIRELKVRVQDVGARRERYGISIPKAVTLPLRPDEDQASQDDIDKAREEFESALARDNDKPQQLRSFDEAIGLITKDLQSVATKDLQPAATKDIQPAATKDLESGATKVRVNLEKIRDGLKTHQATTEKTKKEQKTKKEEKTKEELKIKYVICMEMLLRTLRAHTQTRVRRTAEKTKEDLKEIADGAEMTNLPTEVMIFCYSKLSRSCKSCLQYLYAFHDEEAISRTSMVRRWLAEGRVEKQGGRSLEEAAELCFKELLFRGFLLPVDTGAAGKVKSCKVDKTVWSFLYHMCRSENFEGNLPYHLNNQLLIRRFVKRQEELVKNPPRPKEVDGPWSICGFRRRTRPRDDDTEADPLPLDGMVKFLNSLDQTYRLNVLDLGGCRGLEKRHLNSICNVLSLKYLSLRNTDVSHLPKHINKLKLLETLDIRETQVPPKDTKRIYLPKLKHLLVNQKETEKGTLWPRMPHKIGRMRYMEILSRVQLQQDHTAAKQELEEVGRLLQLRKLGVVLVGSSEAQENMNQLLRVITKLSECLRSLSVWITALPSNGGGTAEDVKMGMGAEEHTAPKLLKSLNIGGVSFRTTGLPSWILKLEHLTEVTLCDTSLSKEHLQDLGKDPHHLHCLRLRSNSYNDHNLTFSKDVFQDLRFFIIEGSTIVTNVEFEEGAAPQLKKIVWRNMPTNKKAGTLSGIGLLPSLEEVRLKGNFTNLSDINAMIGHKLKYEDAA